MKYRHRFHAGNFADVHKHVALLALLAALQRKPKGFLYLDTHAGRGSYDLSGPESATGIARLATATPAAPELQHYLTQLARLRGPRGARQRYPGSPLLAASVLRSQDRAVLIELQLREARALEGALAGVAADGGARQLRVEHGDGFARLRALLPPAERRGLVFIDPPYEQTRQDFAQVMAAVTEGLERFATGVFAAWYPIKQAHSTDAWLAACAQALAAPTLVSELWLYPRDSRVGLNGSGLLIANPPYLLRERMQSWLPELERCLAAGPGAGSCTRMLSESR